MRFASRCASFVGVYRKQIRRRRAILVALVVACLILISFSFRASSGGADDEARGGLATVLALPAEGVNRALKPVRDLADWVGDTTTAIGENKELKAQLEEANAEIARHDSAVADNRQFRDLLELGESDWAAEYEIVTARVVVRSPTVWWSRVVIDRGTSDGVAVGDAVIGPAGLVGRVRETTRISASIELITDSASAVSARVVPSGAQGIVIAEVGNFESLTLDFIDREQSISEGNQVVTAGWTDGNISSAYPPDIPIGVVATVSSAGREGYQEVTVTPHSDMRSLDWLQVLTAGPPRPDVGLEGDE